MEAAFAELPLALFTTLAPIGAGAFVALAIALLTTPFSDEQLKRIDRMTLIPLVVVIMGFAASFFHLASPLHAPGVFSGVGASPLSNEILVGAIFTVLAVVYVVCALTGRLSGGARKVLVVVVAASALVFACFTGLAYVMETIASWNSPLSPVQIVGFALAGGIALGTLVLALSGALPTALQGAYRQAALIVVVAGAVLALVGLCGQAALVGSLANPHVAGADLVAAAMPWLAGAVVCLVLGCAATVVALRGRSAVVAAVSASTLVVVGVFVARLVFYGLQLSVGLA